MFVAAILVLSDAVAHLEPPNRVMWVVAVFVALWCVWLQTTLFTNVFRVQDMTHQILVLTQMFVVILVTMEAHEGVVHDAIALSLSYGALIAIVAIMYWRSARDGGAGARYTATRSYFLIASAVVFGVAAAVPVVRGLVWIVALVLSFGPFRWQPRSDVDRIPDLDENHLAERMGALTIIVCGEAFVKVAIVVSQGAIEDVDIVALAFQFVLTFAIWLSYFVDFPEAGFRRPRLAAWIVLHLVVQLGIAAARSASRRSFAPSRSSTFRRARSSRSPPRSRPSTSRSASSVSARGGSPSARSSSCGSRPASRSSWSAWRRG